MHRSNHRNWVIGIIVFSLCATVLQPARTAMAAEEAAKKSTESKSSDVWQVIYIGEQRIGYARIRTRETKKDGKPILVTTNTMQLKLKRFGQTLNIQYNTRTEETKTGQLLNFEFEMRNPPAAPTISKGKIDGTRITIKTTIAGRTTSKRMAWDRSVKSPSYQDQLMKDPPFKPGDQRSFKTYVPELNQVTNVSLSALGYSKVELLDGKKHNLLKLKVTQSILPSMTTYAFLDRTGESLKTEADFLGSKMITYTVGQAAALEELAGAELDIATSTLVRMEKPLKQGHDSKRAVYKITISEEDAAKAFVNGGTQSVKVIDPETVELTVTAIKIPASTRTGKIDPQYTANTKFLQIRDLAVVEHANRASAGEFNPGRIARRMEKYVYEKIDNKNFSTALASAAEVAKSLEGDCTEHAVLLAAMLRAKKIPSKVAVGLVYVDRLGSFGGHMWTEAYLGGKWVPLDATLGLGGIGAGHIKMSESSFSDDAPSPVLAFLPLTNALGKIEIELIESE